MSYPPKQTNEDATIPALPSRDLLEELATEHPLPWTTDECENCFAVRDHDGKAVLHTRRGSITGSERLARWIVQEANASSPDKQ
jgi:hypothetical protein